MFYADTEWYNNIGYVNNSLEGTIFDSANELITLESQQFSPKFKFFDTPTVITALITSAAVTSNVCTITCGAGHTFAEGDVVSITGIDWVKPTMPYVNGVWTISSVDGNDFSYEIIAPDGSWIGAGGDGAQAIKGSVFEIRDDRVAGPPGDPRGLSFTSTFFTPAKILNSHSPSRKRVLPSDMYVRFRFQTGSDTDPQGGINSNLFSVVNDADINIKPMLWGYFFGYSTASLPADATALHVAFNSYAIVLRSTGSGSRLEFALLKFDWGTIGVGDWMANRIDNETNRFEIEGTDLGYLIATNPDVENSNVTEIAVSDSFTYDSEFAARFNLKITIRKHLLTDSSLDQTYLVNLMTNSTYEEFGPGRHYDSILHGYINRPTPVSVTTTGVQGSINDLMLAPMMYFKFNNTNEENVGAPNLSSSPPNPGSSKIVLDSLFYRQLNSNVITPYLY